MNEQSRKSTKKNELTSGLAAIISSNLKQLIQEKNITQKDLAQMLGVSAASMTDYCKGEHIPGADFFVALKNLYNISIDDFLTKSIYPTPIGQPAQWEGLDAGLWGTYRKYCGLYFVYYFDTSNYKGRDFQTPAQSLLYGVLYIYENPSSLTIPEFSCAAVLGIGNRENVRDLKKKLEEFSAPAEKIDHMAKKYMDTFYFGSFELSQKHAFITMSHETTDKALFILHRVDNNKPNYRGGIGTINSISKGRERAPVVQFMGISRYPLSLSEEEIHHSLLLGHPTFVAKEETQEMIRVFKTMFLETEGNHPTGFSEYQKAVVVSSTLERYIKKNMERNIFRYGKVSEKDDDTWYHILKHTSQKMDPVEEETAPEKEKEEEGAAKKGLEKKTGGKKEEEGS